MVPPFSPASDYVPSNINAASWDALEPLYRGLIERSLKCSGCLERLLLDRSELDAAASEASSDLYIAMTCHTEDSAVKKAYLDHAEQVLPKLKQASFDLDKKIAQSPFAADLDPARYGVLLRDLKARVELFRPENIPLETELTRLSQRYQEILGSQTVTFDGREQTIQQMGVYLEKTDRAVRESAWRAIAQRRLQDREALDALFDEMLALRNKVAINAGFATFRDYAFRSRLRFDYTPDDCAKFASGVERTIVPALKQLHRDRAKSLGVEKVRPWDLSVDPMGRPPLKPFGNTEELVTRTSRLFHRMDPSLGSLFDSLRSERSLDLESRKGKAPGGYQATRDRRRLPFIFMNAVGLQRDVETMVHEAGHAFHALLCRAEDLHAYRAEIPLEFCEVASMSMELTSYPYLDEFYTPDDARRARRTHAEGLAGIMPWIATIDQFQQWIYTNPGHSRAGRTAAWLSLLDRFGGEVDWTGLEDARQSLWHRQLHIFESPFYYIEYGIAQLGALQLYSRYKREPAQAIAGYKHALSLGGSKPLPALFSAAGLRFDLSPASIAASWGEVERELQTSPA